MGKIEIHADLQECTELGIKGSNIARELAQLQHQLPGIYAEALTTINDAAITSAMQHYATFTAYAHNSTASDAGPPTPAELLPMVDDIWKLQSATAMASAFPAQSDEENVPEAAGHSTGEEDSQKQSADGINVDWDVAGGAEPSANSAADASTAVDIDWDFDIQPNDSAAEQARPDTDAQGTDSRADTDAQGTDIDWDIDMTASVQEQIDSASPALASTQEAHGGASAQKERWPESAVQLSQDSACRTSLLNDLYELKSFLVQQEQELGSGEKYTTALQVMLVVQSPKAFATYTHKQCIQGLVLAVSPAWAASSYTTCCSQPSRISNICICC